MLIFAPPYVGGHMRHARSLYLLISPHQCIVTIALLRRAHDMTPTNVRIYIERDGLTDVIWFVVGGWKGAFARSLKNYRLDNSEERQPNARSSRCRNKC